MSFFDDPETIERMRAAFRATPLHALLGIEYVDGAAKLELGASEEDLVVTMPVAPEAYGTGGNLHGGAIATLVDVASATAAARNSAFEPGVTALVTADIHVRYLGRPKGDLVHARARVVKAGRHLIVVECKVVDREQNVIAIGDFSSMLVPVRPPLAGATRMDALPDA